MELQGVDGPVARSTRANTAAKDNLIVCVVCWAKIDSENQVNELLDAEASQ